METFIAEFATPLLLAAITAIIGFVGTKFKGYISEDTMRKIAEDVTSKVEEEVAKAVKEKQPKIPGNEKFDKAVTLILERVPSLSKEKAEELVQSAVDRLPTLGASGKKK